MSELSTTYLGLPLASPIVASPGPVTGDLDRLTVLEESGVGAIVLPSLFEEQIEHDTSEIDRLLSAYAESSAEATSYFPDVDDYNTGPDHYLEMVESSKRRVGVPVIASLNGTSAGGWLRYARLLEDAGADAIELNLYVIAADPAVSGVTMEAEQVELVSSICRDARVPISIKLSPFYTSLAAFAIQLQDAGAAGLTLFNRFYLPDLDLETLDVQPRIALSTPEELRLPLRWIGILRQHLRISLAGSTGVHRGTDAAKLILAGADVAMTTSALLQRGPEHVQVLVDGLLAWMAEHDYASVSQMRGAVRRDAAVDPNAYERANYIGNLARYQSTYVDARHPS